MLKVEGIFIYLQFYIINSLLYYLVQPSTRLLITTASMEHYLSVPLLRDATSNCSAIRQLLSALRYSLTTL